jgi:protein-S-isoprenylcysteine O-methyltransferase Ste14
MARGVGSARPPWHGVRVRSPLPGAVHRLRAVALVGLAVVFTLALTWVTVELPGWLAALASRWIHVLGYDPLIETNDVQQVGRFGWQGWEAANRFIAANHLEVLGAASLALVLVLVIAGFALGRRVFVATGAIALFLPVFGSFAGSMFFLAGIGILRVLWLPAWGTALMGLGDVAYLPYMAVVWPLWQAGIDARTVVAYAGIGIGLLIFVAGTGAWLLARVEGRQVATTWIYRHSRHPQYLGWIVWSWGMTVLGALQPMPHGGVNPGAALAWMLSTAFIVGVAWLEESHMRARASEAYEAYRRQTPFLFRVPAGVAGVISAPVRLLAGTDQPSGRLRIAGCVAVYVAIACLLSLPFVVLDWPHDDWWAWPALTLGSTP